MFKKLAIVVSVASFSVLAARAANISFVGNGYVILDINGAGNSYYDLNNQGNDGVTPSYDTNDSTPTAFSRTFTIDQGTSISLGAQEQTYPSTSGTSAFLGYRITNLTETTGSYTEMNLPFQQNTGQNDQWQQLASTSGVDVGSSLTPGTYLLEVYEHASNNGDIYNQEGASGDDWEAEIQVNSVEAVPEPSTVAAGVLAIVGTFFLRRRRKRPKSWKAFFW